MVYSVCSVPEGHQNNSTGLIISSVLPRPSLPLLDNLFQSAHVLFRIDVVKQQTLGEEKHNHLPPHQYTSDRPIPCLDRSRQDTVLHLLRPQLP